MKKRKSAKLKDIELKVISELMKNSRRSDRELARSIGISQPTVTRVRTQLENEGYIQEYTMIPDFRRLGYQIMAFELMGRQEDMSEEKRLKLRQAAEELEKRTPLASLTVANGIGLDKGRILINFYKDYASYTEGMNIIRSLPDVSADKLESFLVDLSDNRNFRILSMKQIARHVQTMT